MGTGIEENAMVHWPTKETQHRTGEASSLWYIRETNTADTVQLSATKDNTNLPTLTAKRDKETP